MASPAITSRVSPSMRILPALVAAKNGNRTVCGIGFCDEVAASGRSAWSTNVLIYNNVVIGCNGNFKY